MLTEGSPVVSVIDDDKGVRQAMRLMLKSAGYHVALYESASAFLEACDPDAAGCIVTDVRMPGMSGLELQSELKTRGIRTPLIVLTGHGDVRMAVQAVQRGAVDFLEKPVDDQTLLPRIEKALLLDARQRREAAQQHEIHARLAKLTPREREVMNLLAKGMGSKEVALRLGLSRKTIDIHRSHVMMKLGIDSVAELVRVSMLADE